MTILKEAVGAVLSRQAAAKEAMAYYEGDIPETFATAKLRRALKTTGDASRLNFCRTIVNAVNNRLDIAKIQGSTARATAVIENVWSDNDLAYESQDIHNKALVYGECFVGVWPDSEGKTQITYNSPESMAIIYDVENPRKKNYAVKVWQSGENQHRCNLYYADKIVKYVAQAGTITDATQWTLTETLDNPWGEVPVFHFRTNRPFGRPEHKDAYDAQNAINKLFITNMFTIDYQGAPQRYALSSVTDGAVDDFDEGDTDRENIGALKNGPGELWYLKGVTGVGQFDAAAPSVFWEPIKDTARAMAALTDTPLHYFEKTGNNPTGNGLRTAEAPLLKKVQDREAAFGLAWRDVFRFVLKIEGIVSEVSVYWKTHESLDELERWDVALKKINAGLSHRQALLEGGYSPDEVDRIMAERTQEAADGLYYQRAPVARVNTNKSETNAVDPQGGMTNG